METAVVICLPLGSQLRELCVTDNLEYLHQDLKLTNFGSFFTVKKLVVVGERVEDGVQTQDLAARSHHF